jgi:hypothetical protein
MVKKGESVKKSERREVGKSGRYFSGSPDSPPDAM